MAKWAIFDSLTCHEQFFCSHLDSYGHFLREFGEQVSQVAWGYTDVAPKWDFVAEPDVSFFLDRYDEALCTAGKIKIAQVAARCSPMPWQVRGPGGTHVYSLVLSSIPAMIEEARAEGMRAEFMPLCFDLRARSAMMGVKRERKCIFLGSTGPNHRRRTELLRELSDMVEVVPPVFGREYFRRLAGATVLIQPHAEWSQGCANSMKMYEAPGVGTAIVHDGTLADTNNDRHFGWSFSDPAHARAFIRQALSEGDVTRGWDEKTVLAHHTYECADRVPRLVELVRGLG